MYAYFVTLIGSPGSTTVFQNGPPDTYSLHVTATTGVVEAVHNSQLSNWPLSSRHKNPVVGPTPWNSTVVRVPFTTRPKLMRFTLQMVGLAGAYTLQNTTLQFSYKPQTLRSVKVATQIQSSRWSTTTTGRRLHYHSH